MSIAPRIASLPVVHGPGNVCQVDLAAIFPVCASIEVAVDHPHWVNVQPSVIYVTPTPNDRPAQVAQAPARLTGAPGFPTTLIAVSFSTAYPPADFRV